jgi:hypothetical protein
LVVVLLSVKPSFFFFCFFFRDIQKKMIGKEADGILRSVTLKTIRNYTNMLRMRICRARSVESIQIEKHRLYRFKDTGCKLSFVAAKMELDIQIVPKPLVRVVSLLSVTSKLDNTKHPLDSQLSMVIRSNDKSIPTDVVKLYLNKHARVSLWNYHHGNHSLTSTCTLCKKCTITAWYSKIVVLVGTYFFVCTDCVQGVDHFPGIQQVLQTRIGRDRIKLWLKFFQWNRVGICTCCKVKKMDALRSDWHSGHKIAKAKGGLKILQNLQPICVDCNISMGTTSIIDYSRSLKNIVCPVSSLDT